MSKKRKICILLTLILCTVATFTIQIFAYETPTNVLIINAGSNEVFDFCERYNGTGEGDFRIVFDDGSSISYNSEDYEWQFIYNDGNNTDTPVTAYFCKYYNSLTTQTGMTYFNEIGQIYTGVVTSSAGAQEAVTNAYNNGYNTAYTLGYTDGSNAQVETDNAGRNLIVATVEAPFNVLMKMLNFEILGINIFGIVAGIFTLMLVGVIIKKVVL